MPTRIRKSMEDKDEGFTLIELLVVIIIIGILAAIAIPVFLNQRKKAVEASLKSDLRTTANEMETYYVDTSAYPVPTQSGNTLTVGTDTVTLTKGNTVSVTLNGSGGTGSYCIKASSTNSSPTTLYYDNTQGGLLAAGTSCT